MDRTFEINPLRNVQAADSKSAVSKEFVGLRKKREKKQEKRNAGPVYSQKSSKGYTNGTSGSREEEEHESKIDITI